MAVVVTNKVLEHELEVSLIYQLAEFYLNICKTERELQPLFDR